MRDDSRHFVRHSKVTKDESAPVELPDRKVIVSHSSDDEKLSAMMKMQEEKVGRT